MARKSVIYLKTSLKVTESSLTNLDLSISKFRDAAPAASAPALQDRSRANVKNDDWQELIPVNVENQVLHFHKIIPSILD